MTKLEAIICGYGTRRERCIYAGSVFNSGINSHIETMCKHYNIPYDSFIYPHVALNIIKFEYQRRVDNLKFSFIATLIADMIQQQMDVDNLLQDDIYTTVENFMNE